MKEREVEAGAFLDMEVDSGMENLAECTDKIEMFKQEDLVTLAQNILESKLHNSELVQYILFLSFGDNVRIKKNFYECN